MLLYEVQFKSVGDEGVRGTHRHVCLTSIKVFILLFNFQLSINIRIIVGWVPGLKVCFGQVRSGNYT